jgi:hypothetical protein
MRRRSAFCGARRIHAPQCVRNNPEAWRFERSGQSRLSHACRRTRTLGERHAWRRSGGMNCEASRTFTSGAPPNSPRSSVRDLVDRALGRVRRRTGAVARRARSRPGMSKRRDRRPIIARTTRASRRHRAALRPSADATPPPRRARDRRVRLPRRARGGAGARGDGAERGLTEPPGLKSWVESRPRGRAL